MSEQAAPADSQQSIESRIGALLGGPSGQPEQHQETQPQQTDQVPETQEATSEQPQAEPTAPDFVEVEYEGKNYQVPPELKEAIIRQSDYTRKTTEVAEQRKLVEHQQAQLRMAALQQAFDSEVAPERQQLSMLDYLITERSKVNFAQMGTDELIRARVELDQLKEQKSAVEAAIGKKQQEHMGKLQEQWRKIQTESSQLLKQRIPQWSEATAKETRDWALTQGFSSEELSSITNPLHAEVLWKAAQYDKTRSAAKPVVEAKAAKVGSANPMPQHVREKLDFRKTLAKTEGKPHERAKAVQARVADIFGKR